MSILILFLSIFARDPTALYALSNIRGTHSFCTITHIIIYVPNAHQPAVTFSQTPHSTVLYIKHFWLKQSSHNLWSQQQHWNAAGAVCCYHKHLLLPQTPVVTHCNVRNSTTKRKNIKTNLHCRFNLVMSCTKRTSAYPAMQFQRSPCIVSPGTNT
jgi:hypothetical protein